jgi:hypothetical protein
MPVQGTLVSAWCPDDSRGTYTEILWNTVRQHDHGGRDKESLTSIREAMAVNNLAKFGNA